jgi:tetratricopeptide (TPR) repeat protein
VDTAAAAHRFRMAVWSAILSVVMGSFFVIVAYQQGWNVGVALLVGLPVVALVTYLLMGVFTNAAASTASASVYGARQGATPPVPQYSLAESLKMRGDYAAARGEFEQLFRAHPTDAEPAARLARLWRDDMNDAAEAAIWFRRALQVPGLPAGQALLLLRELVEVHVHRLGNPRPAFADLARVARTMPDTPAGSWAARELARLKADIPRDEDNV